MSRIESVLRALCADLARIGSPWALVGGLAVSVRTEPRFTRDVDVALAVPDDRHAEAAARQLVSWGYRPLATVEQTEASRLATVRLAPPGEPEEGLVVDILFASSGIEAELCAEATPLEILPHLVAPVATVPHLIALKVLSRDDRTRPQDRTDLAALIRMAAGDDLDRARAAVQRIQERGYHRSRDLRADLEAAEREFRS